MNKQLIDLIFGFLMIVLIILILLQIVVLGSKAIKIVSKDMEDMNNKTCVYTKKE